MKYHLATRNVINGKYCINGKYNTQQPFQSSQLPRYKSLHVLTIDQAAMCALDSQDSLFSYSSSLLSSTLSTFSGTFSLEDMMQNSKNFRNIEILKKKICDRNLQENSMEKYLPIICVDIHGKFMSDVLRQNFIIFIFLVITLGDIGSPILTKKRNNIFEVKYTGHFYASHVAIKCQNQHSRQSFLPSNLIILRKFCAFIQ